MSAYLKKSIIVLLILGYTNTAFSQADSIDIFIKAQMERRKIPGLQLAIVRDGKIIKSGNYGLANVQDSIPVSNNSVFTINSITKAFTGVALLQLVEAGKLKLEDPLSEHLGDIPEAWKPVTILQLLSHTSGIPLILDEEESVLIAPTLEEAWKKTIRLPMDFKPGESFRYNQTNYLLLGRIIGKLSGTSFTEFITKEQLIKVGMPKTISAGFGANKDIVSNAAGGYRYTQGKLINMFFSFPPALQTAAGMSSTAKELAQWVIALQNRQLLTQKASLDMLWTPALLNNGKTAGFNSLLNGYAVGWPIVKRNEHPAAAAVGGGRSAVFVYPKDDLSVIVLTNLAGGSPEGFIDEIAGFFIPDMKEANGFGLSSPAKLIWAIMEKNGYKHAAETVAHAREKDQDFILHETEINSWGYKLFRQKRLKDALEIFKLNIHLYPRSANAFDSLGEIYAALGNTALAIQSYELSFKLDPKNINAEEQIKILRANK